MDSGSCGARRAVIDGETEGEGAARAEAEGEREGWLAVGLAGERGVEPLGPLGVELLAWLTCAGNRLECG